MNQLFYYLLGQGLTWIIIFVNPLVCLLPDFGLKTWTNRYHKSPVDIILEEERDKEVREVQMKEEARRISPKQADNSSPPNT